MKRAALACVLVMVPFLASGMAAAAAPGGGSQKRAPSRRPQTGRVLSGDRIVTHLDSGWRFVQDDALTEDAALAVPGSAWQQVVLPHTWNANDAASLSATVPYKRGRGWYRLSFQRPARGARHWLQFDGASIVADVWLNGTKVGQHRGAFTAFRFDVTDALRAGENVLLVRTDNTEPKADSDLTAIAPLSGDFNMAGGLYRRVSLVSTAAPVHIALDDLGGPGVYARTTVASAASATVRVRAKVTNAGARASAYAVRASLLARPRPPAETGSRQDSRELSVSGRTRVAPAPAVTVEVTQDLVVPKPHLWRGLADPYLYSLVVEVLDRQGRPVDRVEQEFGIRQMAFDANEGFSLNGKATPLRGVAMHQDYLGKAWAIGSPETDESLALVKEIGANTVRLAHYPHAEYTLEQADKLGFVVWAEVPFVNGTRVACSSEQATPEFAANLEQQLRELIRQQYNHASVGMWSIGNETTMTQTMGCGRAGKAGIDNVTRMLRRLQEVAKAEDPGRVTTMADLNEGMSAFGASLTVGGISDIWALNRYFMWYYGQSAGELARNLDELHAKYPNQPIGISEYGAGAAVSDHTDNPRGGPVSPYNMGVPRVYQPEEYASYVHEQNYAVIAARKYVWGSYVWAMFDFGSGIRNEGDVRGVNSKGLVTFDRKTRKDPFYFYKANWSDEPVMYIAGRRYTNRAYPVADVTVYSNADSVKLTVNGTEVATLASAHCPLHACVFENVRLQPGVSRVAASGSRRGTAVRDQVEWTLANPNDVNIAAGQITTGFRSSKGALYGSDNFFRGGAAATLASTNFRAPGDNTPVKGAADENEARLYSAYRSGTFRYDVPVSNGSYAVTLGFLEPLKTTQQGGRVFSVEANGVEVLENLDVLREAGGYRSVVAKTFPVAVTNGRLELAFTPSAGDAIVSNISIAKRQ